MAGIPLRSLGTSNVLAVQRVRSVMGIQVYTKEMWRRGAGYAA